MFRTIVDVNPKNSELLSFKQMISLLKYVPEYTLSKYKYSEYFGFKESDIYSVNSFNIYGDVDAHWDLPNRLYKPLSIKGKYNPLVITRIESFVIKAKQKGAKIYISFPGIDEITYINYKEKIKKVERSFHYLEVSVLRTPERYVFPKEMIFNGCYHLNKAGVD